MRLLVIAAGTRRDSCNRRLARVAAGVARLSEATVTLLELADLDIPLYSVDRAASDIPADVYRLTEILSAHPAWLICSPAYNGRSTSLLKNSLAWAGRPVKGYSLWNNGDEPFVGKVVGLLSASTGVTGGLLGLNQLRTELHKRHCWVCPEQYAMAHGSDAFADDGGLKFETDVTQVHCVVDQVLWASRRLSSVAATNPPRVSAN